MGLYWVMRKKYDILSRYTTQYQRVTDRETVEFDVVQSHAATLVLCSLQQNVSGAYHWTDACIASHVQRHR